MHLLRNCYINHRSICFYKLSLDTSKTLETNFTEAYCVPGKMWGAKHQRSLRAE